MVIKLKLGQHSRTGVGHDLVELHQRGVAKDFSYIVIDLHFSPCLVDLGNFLGR